mgnify:CR=1 FL=1
MRQKFNYLFIGLLFSGLAFFSYLFLLLYSDFTPQHLEVLISFKSFILILAAFNLVGFGVLMIHNWQKRSFQFLVKRKERLIIDCILTAIILFLMNYLVLSIVKAIFEVPAPFTLKGSGLRMIALVWLVEMVITNLTLTINFYRQLVLLHERTEQVEENSIKAQYAALQNQLNPHFLFNSLNTLISEIEYAPKNAILFTQRLSDVYRYILQSQQQRLVTIESELSFIDSYIFLHKVRLGDCIRIENRIEADNYDLKLPSLTLQLLVENVIKHNIINMDMPMNILIDYDSENGRITVSGDKTSSGMDISTEPISDNAGTWRGIAIKVDDDGRVVWANEFGYSTDEGCYAVSGFTENSYALCGFETLGISTPVFIRVDEAVKKSEISEVEGIEIPSLIERYNITTSVNGVGGTITGQNDELVETVKYGEDSTKEIVVIPNKGYEILSIIVNGEKISFTPDENGAVTLEKFTNVTEDINIIAEFSNNTSSLLIRNRKYKNSRR